MHHIVFYGYPCDLPYCIFTGIHLVYRAYRILTVCILYPIQLFLRVSLFFFYRIVKFLWAIRFVYRVVFLLAILPAPGNTTTIVPSKSPTSTKFIRG